MEELLKKYQKIRFSGAGDSHQNGAAKHAIKTVVTTERTMLMHAVLICYDEKLSTDIWPMTMIDVVWVYNRTPDTQSGLSAIGICSG